MSMQPPPPGWYADPSGMSDTLRWWDGTAWTDTTQPEETGYTDGGYQPGAWPPGAYDQGDAEDQAGYQQGSFPPGAYDIDYQQGGYDQQAGGYQQGGGYQQAGYEQPDPYGGGPPQQSGQPQQAGYAPEQYGQPQQYEQGWAGAGGGWSEPGPSWQGDGTEKPRKTLPWLVAGGAGLVVIVIVAGVVLFATGVIGGNSPDGGPPVTKPTKGGNTQAPGGSSSPVVGRIKDKEAGISYAKLGGKWAVLQPGGEHGMEDWTAGQYQIAQAQYKPGEDYLATYASTPLPEYAPYSGPSGLQRMTTALAQDIEQNYYPRQHTRKVITNKAVQVDGHQAWKITYSLSFPNAEANGWKFQSERVVIMVIDRGQGNRPAVFYFTLPNNLPLQADMQTVVSSIKVIG